MPRFQVSVTKKKDGKYRTSAIVPMSLVDKAGSQDMAFHASRAVNAMLESSGSDLRVVFYDIVQKRVMHVAEVEIDLPEPAGAKA